jgi:uncharacterized protein YmfQ (DUF2313 family)
LELTVALTAEAYRDQLLALLPSGAIWTRDPDSVLGQLLMALAEELARAGERLEDLLDEADPRTTFEMLTDWEALCGLPDECYGDADTLAQRRAAVLEHLTGQTGIRPVDYEAMAAAHGHAAECIEFTPLRAGFRVGDRSYGTAWAYVMRMESGAPADVEYFHAGVSCAGDRLAIQGDKKYECMINSHVQAHLEVQFSYVRRLGTEIGTRLLTDGGLEIKLY